MLEGMAAMKRFNRDVTVWRSVCQEPSEILALLQAKQIYSRLLS